MTKLVAAMALSVLFGLLAAGWTTRAAVDRHRPLQSSHTRIDVEPDDVAVFAGASLRFHARIVGATGSPAGVRWAAFGVGAIDETGLYRAPASAGGAASIVATASGVAGGARVAVVAPPRPGGARAIVACYGDGALDVRGSLGKPAFGRLLAGDAAGDVKIAAGATTAVVTVGDHLVALDLSTMITRASAPVGGARFSELALLGAGAFAAATNANADAGGKGIAVFRIRAGAAPQLVSTAPAGETPEGIAVDRDGNTMYVAAVNSNVVTRLVLNADGLVRKTGSVRTGTRPFGVAIDVRHRMLIVADNDTPTLSGSASRPGLEAFSLPSLRRIGASQSTGSPNALPLGAAVDPGTDRLFVTNEGDDNVAVFGLPSLRREATLRVGRTPWLPSVDAARHLLFVPDARDDAFEVFDTRTLAHEAAGVLTCAYPVAVGVAD